MICHCLLYRVSSRMLRLTENALKVFCKVPMRETCMHKETKMEWHMMFKELTYGSDKIQSADAALAFYPQHGATRPLVSR